MKSSTVKEYKVLMQSNEDAEMFWIYRNGTDVQNAKDGALDEFEDARVIQVVRVLR